MGRLSEEQIRAEVAAKGCTLVDCTGYVNINSTITVKCAKGHIFQTTLAAARALIFTCPQCDKVVFANPTTVPPKKGYRVIAFDQATERFGLSIFDDGELVFLHLYNFVGLVNKRIVQIKKFVEMIIREWQPDYIVMEDIQYQQRSGVITFKILAMLLGVIQTVCEEEGVPYEAVSPNVWRKYAGTCGSTRTEEKRLSVAVVKEKYGVRVSDDVAEAILIGRYGAQMHKKETPLAFGRK